EGGEVNPRELAAAVAESLAELGSRWPRAPVPPGASTAIHQLRGAAQIRAAVDPEVKLFASSGGTAWTVILDSGAAFEPGCLYRTLIIQPVADLAAVPELIGPLATYLQTAAAAVDEARLPSLVISLTNRGVTRICPLGRTQRPAPGWRPDGRPRL